MKIYVGCSLTQAPEEFRESVEALKNELRIKYTVLDFVGLVAGTAREVYEWDVQKCVAGCDVFVAICDYPAIGLGYELATAIEVYGKPVIAVAHRDAHITRLIEGTSHPKFTFKRYDILREVVAFVDNLRSSVFVNGQESLCNMSGICSPATTDSDVSNCVYCGRGLVRSRDGQSQYTWDADLHKGQKPQNF